ncbi:MAG: ATP-binding protein [Tissierellia bacterium]|nr:ATP-binding protein [Tissierellia bacterium]
MKVVGLTSQQEVTVGSRERNFRINEYLVVMDPAQGEILGEVVEAKTYNRFMPLDIGGDFVDSEVLSSLEALGYQIGEETIYLAKVRFFNEALYPVLTGSDLREPSFEEIRDLLLPGRVEDSLLLGLIRNTQALAREMDENLKDLCYTFEKGQFLPQEEVPYFMDIRGMHQYPHVGIFGGSGSGKSFGMRVLLEELMAHHLPGLVLDPHYEMDFSLPAGELGEDFSGHFVLAQIGQDIGVHFEDLRQRELIKLLSAISPLSESMEANVNILHKPKESYESFKNRLEFLQRGHEMGSREKIEQRLYEEAPGSAAYKELDLILSTYETYGNKTHPNSVNGIYWRLLSLGREGIFGKTIHPIEEGLQLGKLVIIQGSTRMIEVFASYILDKLYMKRRDYKDALYRKSPADYFPPFFVVTDEAHNFAPKGYDTPSRGILKEISQEGRKYGVFLVLATQRPTLLDDTITAQLNTKCIFRTVRASDIDTIREETDLTAEETRRLPYLRTGDVFISSSQMGRTAYVRIRAAKTESPHRENPFDELFAMRQKQSNLFYDSIEDLLPLDTSTGLIHAVEVLEKKEGLKYSLDQVKGQLAQLAQAGLLEEETSFLGTKRYKKKEGGPKK